MTTNCSGCGSTPADREVHTPGNDGLKLCPHCGSQKCCMCDSGDDSECLGCGDLPDDYASTFEDE